MASLTFKPGQVVRYKVGGASTTALWGKRVCIITLLSPALVEVELLDHPSRACGVRRGQRYQTELYKLESFDGLLDV